MEKILELVLSLLLGGIGGTLASLYKKREEAKIDDEIKAKRKLKEYSRLLLIALSENIYRFNDIKTQKNENNGLKQEKKSSSIDWYVKNGYYITSTIYQMSLLSSWISIYERDVAFLDFGNKGLSSEFYKKIKNIKLAFSNTDKHSCMYYYYFNAIGDKLINYDLMINDHYTPFDYAQFIDKLHSDKTFELFYDQAFIFIHEFTNSNNIPLLDTILKSLNECKEFIESITDGPSA